MLTRRGALGGPRPASTLRRRLGRALVVLGALGLASSLLGWLFAVGVGTDVAEDADHGWDGGRLYVVGASLQSVTCTITSPEEPPRSVRTTRSPTNVGFDLRATGAKLSPGGVYLRTLGGVPGTLRCNGDVRVTTGAAALVTVPAERGLWVVGPAAILLVTGSTVRRGPARRTP